MAEKKSTRVLDKFGVASLCVGSTETGLPRLGGGNKLLRNQPPPYELSEMVAQAKTAPQKQQETP